MGEPRDFEGRVVVVTGGGRGIGAACAVLLAARGARVVVAARTEGEVIKVVTHVSEQGGVALPVVVDVTREDAVARLFEATDAAFGPVDVLVSCAGTLLHGALVETSLDDWSYQLGPNLTGAFLCARAAATRMRARGRGVIVHVASQLGAPGARKLPGLCAYSAANAGVVGLSEALAAELGPSGIRVVAVTAGPVNTDMFGLMRSLVPEVGAGMSKGCVADVVAFAASDAGAGLHGAVVAVPGPLGGVATGAGAAGTTGSGAAAPATPPSGPTASG